LVTIPVSVQESKRTPFAITAHSPHAVAGTPCEYVALKAAVPAVVGGPRAAIASRGLLDPVSSPSNMSSEFAKYGSTFSVEEPLWTWAARKCARPAPS
jgi:hypothetical protein